MGTGHATPFAGHAMRTREEKILLVIGLLAAMAAAAIPFSMAPPFREAYAHIGIEPPFITRLFLQPTPLFWLLPFASLAVWLYWPTARRRAWVSCLVGIVSLVVMVPLAAAALYLPIFQVPATS